MTLITQAFSSNTLSKEDRVRGAVYLFAFGDAWGYVTEFMKYPEITFKQPVPPKPLVVSDDTQMGLYTMKAVETILSKYPEDELKDLMLDEKLRNNVRIIFAEAYLNFYFDRDNNRAPGSTCISALNQYLRSEVKETGKEGLSIERPSKGCGTVMRAPWLGLLPFDRSVIASLAIVQSETTHGHPIAAISAAVAAILVYDILNNLTAPDGRGALIQHALNILTELEELVWSKELREGVFELSEVLNKTVKLYVDVMPYLPEKEDISAIFGAGWVAEEALAVSLVAADWYGASPEDGIQRLVYTGGDSDTIAALGGSFLGAFNGYSGFDYEVSSKLEPRYQAEIKALLDFILTK